MLVTVTKNAVITGLAIEVLGGERQDGKKFSGLLSEELDMKIKVACIALARDIEHNYKSIMSEIEEIKTSSDESVTQAQINVSISDKLMKEKVEIETYGLESMYFSLKGYDALAVLLYGGKYNISI